MKIHKIGLFTGFTMVGLWFASAFYLFLFHSWKLAFIEILLIGFGILVVNVIYCRKCPLHKKGCMHYCLGNIARMFKDQSHQSYNSKDILSLLIGLLPAVLFPQFWLINHLPLFILYWMISAVTIITITRRVCPDCGNTNCPVKRTIAGSIPG